MMICNKRLILVHVLAWLTCSAVWLALAEYIYLPDMRASGWCLAVIDSSYLTWAQAELVVRAAGTVFLAVYAFVFPRYERAAVAIATLGVTEALMRLPTVQADSDLLQGLQTLRRELLADIEDAVGPRFAATVDQRLTVSARRGAKRQKDRQTIRE